MWNDDQVRVEKCDDGSYDLILRIKALHPQVLPFFPEYRLDKPAPGIDLSYSSPTNCVGHQQRSLMCTYALRGFIESGGLPGVDIGSAGCSNIGCVTTDIYGNGETPNYGGVMSGVNVKCDMNDLSIFESNSFSYLLANHSLEHGRCRFLHPQVPQDVRYQYNCNGAELEDLLRRHWVRVVRSGGYLCIICPDERYAEAQNSSILFGDPDHKHRTSPQMFEPILDRMKDVVEVLSLDTLNNEFSFEICLKKK